MKWEKVQQNPNYTYWWLKDYPFFDSNISYQVFSHKLGSHKLGSYKKYKYKNNLFGNIEDAKNFVKMKLRESCENYLKSGVKNDISISDGIWPNNTGEGKYFKNQEYKKYHWIWGTHLPWISPCRWYAIRCNAGVDIEQIKLKLLNRHCKRFLLNK